MNLIPVLSFEELLFIAIGYFVFCRYRPGLFQLMAIIAICFMSLKA